MPYLYRRTRGLVDLFIEKFYRKKIVIRDGLTEGGLFILAINDVVFRVVDPDAGADSSAAIATSFETEINLSSLPITATTDGGTLILMPDFPNEDFSTETFTDDPEGSMFIQSAPPEAYQIKNAANWDVAFANLPAPSLIPQIGATSPSVRAEATAQNLAPYVRWRFNPSDYGLEDDDVLFFTIAPVIDSVEGAESPIYILLTSEQLKENHTSLLLAGDAPAAADSDSALEFKLPLQTTSLVVKNTDGANVVFLSFGTGDAEVPLAPGETFRDNRFGSGDIRVRGDGAPASVYIYLSLNNQSFL